jgi:cyclopropane fatty-acyl-phospholipid synthase-like methyltransferase
VNPDTVQKILALNRQFYQTFAAPFSDSRMRLQPGVRQMLERLPPCGRILDLGCGNGYLASQIAQKYPGATYIGLDNSPGLLEQAESVCTGLKNASFHRADLASPTWEAVLTGGPEAPASPLFDTILAFAVLHHIPGAQTRASMLEKIRSLLQPQGQLIHSEWQFLKNPRLRQRIQPWEMAGISEQDVDPGDYLLDWRQGGQGLRYVHHFAEAELDELARETGFIINETFYADGKGGDLGLYQVWLPG